MRLNKIDRIIIQNQLKEYKEKLSDEQYHFIELALEGENILVDACIGSGKTTSIQALCDLIPPKFNILYMTYNQLLKVDAKQKIKNKNATVTNYHGFVYPYLLKHGVNCGVAESLKEFILLDPEIKHYDVLIVDEYQDINLEASKCLELVKKSNPDIQCIFVGDMNQKIYDFTVLDVTPWIDEFLEHNYHKLTFTKCFRLGHEQASKIGSAWNKPINGMNKNQKIKVMNQKDVVDYLIDKDPGDILCLGKRAGDSVQVLNDLQYRNPKAFNKNTCYVSIREKDNNTKVSDDVCIFTTYDSSKGMERDICVVFDYFDQLLQFRSNLAGVDPEIIKNIFLVAASRGKDEIIFVSNEKNRQALSPSDEDVLGFIDIHSFLSLNNLSKQFKPFMASSMFDFNYYEDVEAAYDSLSIKKIKRSLKEIPAKINDGLLDISAAVGNYVSAAFFDNIDVRSHIAQHCMINKIQPDQFYVYLDLQDRLYEEAQANPRAFKLPYSDYSTNFDHDKKDIQWQLLVDLACESGVKSYMTQIVEKYVTPKQHDLMMERLGNELSKDDQNEIGGSIHGSGISIHGRLDAIHDDYIYELKFVNELEHTHFLQLAIYLVMFGFEKGRLWNVRTNEMYEVSIPDRKEFMDLVVTAITKRSITEFDGAIKQIRKGEVKI